MPAFTAAFGNGRGRLVGTLREAVDQAGFADSGLTDNNCRLVCQEVLQCLQIAACFGAAEKCPVANTLVILQRIDGVLTWLGQVGLVEYDSCGNAHELRGAQISIHDEPVG